MNPIITTWNYIDNIKDNTFDVPKSQELDKKYINDVVASKIKETPKTIHFSKHIVMAEYKNDFNIIDGAHTLAIMKILYDAYKYNSTVDVITFQIKSIREINDMYDEYHKTDKLLYELKMELAEKQKTIDKVNNELERANKIIKDRNLPSEPKGDIIVLMEKQMQCKICNKIFAKSYKDKHETSQYHQNALPKITEKEASKKHQKK